MEKAVVLIDGEHYIPVTQWAIDTVVRKNYDVLGAVFIGGTEKIGTQKDLEVLGLPIVFENDPLTGIDRAIDQLQPDVVVDLSDDPVVGYEQRFRFANLILHRQVAYAGSDFRFDPPQYIDVVTKPSISVIGTGKRTGKTAACAYIARVLSGQESIADPLFDPCIVTMGRGGPPEPELVLGKELEMTPSYLLSLADQGKHAASDHFEDALMTRLTTIGARRCGGGFAGMVYTSNVHQSAEMANKMIEDLVLFEGSGAAIPPVKVDTQILIVGAHQPMEYIAGYMGPYRVMRSDLIIMTMCEPPMASLEKVQQMDALIRGINSQAKVVHTIFRPKPLENVMGAKVLFAVTTLPSMVNALSESLEDEHGCEVIMASTHLANRQKLIEDITYALDEHPEIDTLITEVKAAGIDVATRMAIGSGLRVVYIDNILRTVGGDGDLPQMIKEIAQLAVKRYAERR